MGMKLLKCFISVSEYIVMHGLWIWFQSPSIPTSQVLPSAIPRLPGWMIAFSSMRPLSISTCLITSFPKFLTGPLCHRQVISNIVLAGALSDQNCKVSQYIHPPILLPLLGKSNEHKRFL